MVLQNQRIQLFCVVEKAHSAMNPVISHTDGSPESTGLLQSFVYQSFEPQEQTGQPPFFWVVLKPFSTVSSEVEIAVKRS